MTTPTQPKLCKDCKWVRTPSMPLLWLNIPLNGAPFKCAAPAPERTVNLATGDWEFNFAEILRNEFPTFCGPEAKWFEPK